MASRSVGRDPRTIARSIPGITDILFPRLGYGLSTLLNRRSFPHPEIAAIEHRLIALSSLRPAMLCELGVAFGEHLARGHDPPDWDECVETAVGRQRRYFNARKPDALAEADCIVAERIGRNLLAMLSWVAAECGGAEIEVSPAIPGYQWVSSGTGDFSVGETLVEVKCGEGEFGAPDLRQILIYWILGYAFALEHGGSAWTKAVLLNPRRNVVLPIDFTELVRMSSGGLSSVEILELFSFITGDYALKELAEFRL